MPQVSILLRQLFFVTNQRLSIRAFDWREGDLQTNLKLHRKKSLSQCYASGCIAIKDIKEALAYYYTVKSKIVIKGTSFQVSIAFGSCYSLQLFNLISGLLSEHQS